MSNDHEQQYAGGISLFAERVKATLNRVTTAVRQFWEGYLQSPSGC